jgi:hypothetical protein
MPRVLVTDDNGAVAWNERVTAADFETEHFRRQLSTRLSWAVADADQNHEPNPSKAEQPATLHPNNTPPQRRSQEPRVVVELEAS